MGRTFQHHHPDSRLMLQLQRYILCQVPASNEGLQGLAGSAGISVIRYNFGRFFGYQLKFQAVSVNFTELSYRLKILTTSFSTLQL